LDALTSTLPVLLGCGTALAIDRLTERAGLTPPNFLVSADAPDADRRRAAALRSVALLLMAVVLWIAVFAPLSVLGQTEPVDTSALTVPQLFFLHCVFVVTLIAWFLLGFLGSGKGLATTWARQLGFRTPALAREIGIGVVAGIAGWLGVIASLLAAATVLFWIGGEDAVPSQPPEVIGWVVALPVAIRVALSLSAGLVEETFFRGFLQPRVGVLLSSLLFVLAHLSYEQPFLLLGVGLLSLLFAYLVRWRQSIWAAITAHAVFDAVQLLIVIPAAMRFLESEAPETVALALAWAVSL
jgi:membrane protease YdiL (CAAX protease family)